MKIIAFHTFLSCLFLASTASATNSSKSPHNTQDAVLQNGATLSVKITDPRPGSVFAHDSAVTFEGQANLSRGMASVGYIYVIDSSGSTANEDAPCDSILECIQTFFVGLHQAALDDGSAKLVGVIDFDSYATVLAPLQDPQNNTEIEAAIYGTYAYGGTNCTAALEQATIMANEALHGNFTDEQVDTVIVFFAGDGHCTRDGRNPEDLAVIERDADALGATGAIVHTIAIGENVDCGPTLYDENLLMTVNNHLPVIPQNGGECISVSEPSELLNFTDDLIGTSLEELEIKYDQEPYRLLKNEEMSMSLPQEGDVQVAFKSRVLPMRMTPGAHIVCVRARAVDTHNDGAMAEDCGDFIVKPLSTDAPTVTPTVGLPTRTPPSQKKEGGSQNSKNEKKGEIIVGAIVLSVAGVILSVLAGQRLMSRMRSGKEELDATLDPTEPVGKQPVTDEVPSTPSIV